jgi:N-acetylmuramoyl-L-alanine amidase
MVSLVDGTLKRSARLQLVIRLMDLSVNFGPRRDMVCPNIIVLHYTAMLDWKMARNWLCNPDAKVSAHYIISECGDVVQLVPEEHRAWHAGVGSWGDITDVNSHSIGIELSNVGSAPFAARLMDALEELLPAIMDRWAIPACRVIAHSDIAPGRKVDPGARFDWARLVRSGLAVSAVATTAVAADPHAFVRDVRTIGYTADVSAVTLLSAFRLRHRQGHYGPLDGWDCALVADLAARFLVAKFGRTS